MQGYLTRSEKPNLTCPICTGDLIKPFVSKTTLARIDNSAFWCYFCSILQKATLRFIRVSDHRFVYIGYGGSTLRVRAHGKKPPEDRGWYCPSPNSLKTVRLYTNFNGIGKECVSLPIRGGRNTDNARELTFPGLISAWLQKCDKEHECWSEGLVLPSRVLDVSVRDGSDDTIRLYESEGELAPYACLSYCWGNALPLTTTTTTYEDRRRGIPFNTLPKTLQDAVIVTRRLGIKYLWVDAVCIIQDSRDDWEVESSKMATIYENAYLVIAADISRDCNTRFLPRRKSKDSKDEQALAKFTESDGSAFTVYGQETDGWGHSDPLDSLPLRQRAWTFQEEILASRIVHFTQNEVYWECRACVFCECADLDGRENAGLASSHPRSNFKRCLESKDPKDFDLYWTLLLDEYLSRDITNQLDRFPALSGLVRALSDVGSHGQYIAGLWSTHLPFALLWSGGLVNYRMSPYRAPSWSPFSLWKVEKNRSSGFDKAYATVQEVECVVSGKDPYGTLSGGKLRLTAPLLQIGQMGHRYHKTPKVYDSRRFSQANYFDFRVPDDETLFWLFVAGDGDINLPRRVEGLVLRPKEGHHVETGDRVFERVGTFKVEDTGSYVYGEHVYGAHDARFQLLKVPNDQTVTIV